MNRIKTYRLFLEQNILKNLKDVVIDIIQPLLDDMSTVEYEVCEYPLTDELIVYFDSPNFNDYKLILDFYKFKKDVFSAHNVTCSLENSRENRNVYAQLTFKFIDNSILESKSEINLNELKTSVVDFIQPLLDDLDIQDATGSDNYYNALWYEIREVCLDDRFGEADSIMVSFYDDVDWYGFHSLHNRDEIYNFFQNNLDRLEIFNIKIVSNVTKHVNSEDIDNPPPMIIYFQYK